MEEKSAIFFPDEAMLNRREKGGRVLNSEPRLVKNCKSHLKTVLIKEGQSFPISSLSNYSMTHHHQYPQLYN